MERKIVRHAVGAAAHDAALDAEFHVGQRVVTIDGIVGRVQFVTASFSPGVTEYQVTLDNGMGGGTYIGSQLRAVPDSYRAPGGPHSNLPAGVTAAIEAEAGEIHLASDDYPEMGDILRDRPDPAGQIRTIGRRSEHEDWESGADVPLRALRPTDGLSRTADAYAQGYDERDDDPNGGSQDTGIYWEAPANQQWRDENLGEPPEPEIEDVPGFGPEQFEQQFGKISTTINGQQIDGHGDAPGHGLESRAQDPNSYDGRSTEGQGDPDQDKPLPGTNEDAEQGSTTGMFPSGVFAGDGFGMGFGSRVPWTGQERTELHGWDNGLAASAGDFVPSPNFTNRNQGGQEELSAPAEEVIERSLQAQASHPDVFCAYRHDGPCLWPEPMRAHGEHMRHSRPRDFHSEIHPVDPDIQSDALVKHGLTPTHVLKGYLGGQHAGSLHFQQSDDGNAAYVTNLENNRHRGQGVASAMMDDLYSHAHRNGMWINHGQRTEDGLRWWNSYHEPHPEHNVHETWPDEGQPANHAHPAMRPWREYWSPHEVAADMHINSEYDEAGGHPRPQFDHLHYEDDPHYERWKNSTKQVPDQDPHADEAMRDAMRDMGGHDEYHGWGDLAREHAHTGALHNPDHHYELHLVNDHGYSPADIERLRNHGLHDMHDMLHQTGLANHRHTDIPGELAAGWRNHEQQQTADRFGLRPTRQYLRHETTPERGGAPGGLPDETRDADPRLPEDPAKLNAFWSSRQAEAGVRVRTNGPNDFTFHHVPDDAEDPDNSLDDGEPDERPDELDAEQDENGLENGDPQTGDDEDFGPDNNEDADEDPGSKEPPGNLPAGVQPPKTPSQRPPNVPQNESAPPETWPLATAPVQERPLPLSQGSQPSPSTRRSNPVKMPLPGTGAGPEIDGEKPGSEDKGSSKEAALAAFTAAAGSQPFRFEFTAAWRDVVAKAKRLRQGNRVRIVHASRGIVIGEVGGDHDVYECGIQRPPGKPQTIQHWACGCPWASFHQDKSYPGRLNGRPCSHVYALQLEASSRYSRSTDGRVYQDPSADELGVPHQVVVKSMPPWGAGGWSQTWLAPAASLSRTAEMFCPHCSGDRDDSGRCMDCGRVSHDPRGELTLHGGRHERPMHPDWEDAPEDDTDWAFYETDDPADNPWGQGRHRSPVHEAALRLLAAGEPAEDIELLASAAGIDLIAAANDPWGDNNLVENPPAKPYGATSPRDPSQNPANTGPLNAPDPENWAEIPETGLSQPMVTTSSLPGLDTPGPAVPDSPSGAVPYPYRANSGPATPADPADPNGLSVDAARDPSAEGADYEQHLIEQHGVDADWASRWDHRKHLNDHDEVNQMLHSGDGAPEGYHEHPYHETPWEQRQTSGQWPDAGHSHSFTASEDRQLPDPDPLGEHHHHPECTCPTCDYDRYHAKHAVQMAFQAGLAELEAAAGELAETAPHEFSGNTPYCHECRQIAESEVHRRAGAEGEFHATPEPALPETTAGVEMPAVSPAGQYALDPGASGGGPGESMHDTDLSPDDTSIQTMGTQNSGGDDELADLGFSVSPQENVAEAGADNMAEQFQATGAARQYAAEASPQAGDTDIAAAAKAYLAKTADVLPDHEAAALISEGRGQRARNLDMLQLEGTHYDGIDEEMAHRGLSLDDYDDDLVVL